jgi:lipid-A-disaccharide synthase
MLIAGEASGDLTGAELIQALREQSCDGEAGTTTDYQPIQSSLAPRFFGAGGPRMAAAGADLAINLTGHSVIGLSDALRHYFKFRRFFRHLFRLALERQPEAIICIDFGGFNRRFAHAIKQHARARSDWFHDWQPKLVQYVSPQVWASRPGRAYQIARDYDLVLSIVPFEKEWYARRVPGFPVEFVGHPIVDRYADGGPSPASRSSELSSSISPNVLLLPGSRAGELERHQPVMIGALALLRASFPELRARMVLTNEALVRQALLETDVAIAATGTVMLECAYFGVPTVALYKTSWSTFQIGKRVVTVKYLAMPNILADEPLFPEFIQDAATPENIARAALELLRDPARRARVKQKLGEITASLGAPGASQRAARAILRLLDPADLSISSPT